MPAFQLVSPFQPAGDQPQAISSLVRGLREGKANQTLLGVTGSGKTFTMANVIAQYGKPTLVMSHNKTLAAQLYGEFKEFFPHNAVHYFVSYYDYYQPEAYIPQRDIYIEKDASINEEIERLRLACDQRAGQPRGRGRRRQRVVHLRLGLAGRLPEDDGPLRVGDIDRPRQGAAASSSTSSTTATTCRSSGASSASGATWSRSGRRTRRSASASSCGATRSRGWRSSTPSAATMLETQEEIYIYPAKHFVLPEERIQGRSRRSARSSTSGCK